MAPQFTEAVTAAIQEAFQYAQAKGHTEVGENHLLRALLFDPESYFTSLCKAASLDPSLLLKHTESALEPHPTYAGAAQAPQVSLGLQQKIQEAEKIAKNWNDSYISGDHLFLAYWDRPAEPFAKFAKDTKKRGKASKRRSRSCEAGSTSIRRAPSRT